MKVFAALLALSTLALPAQASARTYSPAELMKKGVNPGIALAFDALDVPVFDGANHEICQADKDGYSYRGLYNFKHNAILMCSNNIHTNAQFVEVITHEAVHMVQDCRTGIQTTSLYAGDSNYIALSDYRESFLEAYEEAGGAEADVTVLWSQNENTPLIWNDPINMKMELPEKFHKVEQISADFDIQYGFTLPIHTGTEGFWGSFGLSASGMKEKDFLRDVLPFKDLLIAISTVFDMHIRQISGNHVLEQSTVSTLEALTPMEIETLKWLAEGYSIKQISDEKLHRSIDSVNIYIRNAKKKLNARTRDQLIAKALILRLIP